MLLPLFMLFLVLWLAFLGGTVGSFLNVVVYRLPVGMSLVHPPSRCPRCLHEIRWYDNIPVLGWLWLRGKCRDCGLPISRRYPIVEAITGGLFLLVAWFNDMFFVWSDSLVAVNGRWEPDLLLSKTGEYLIQIVLVCTLWTAGLMQYDRQRPPARLIVCMGFLIGLSMMAWIQFGTKPDAPLGTETFSPSKAVVTHYMVTVATSPWQGVSPLMSLFSCIATALFAMLATYFWTYDPQERDEGRWIFVELAALCGLVVPAPSMIFVIAWAVLIGLLAILLSRRSNYSLFWLLIGLLIHWCFGSYYLGILFQAIPFQYRWLHIVWFSLLLILLNEACVMIRWRAEEQLAADLLSEALEPDDDS